MSQTKAQLLDGKSATIQFTGGSASVPAVSFTGDTNTGIYSPGADQLAISTAGSGRLFVDSSGNIGLGTNSTPSYLLDLLGSAPRIRVKDSSTGAAFHHFENNSGNFYLGIDTSTGGSLSAGNYARVLWSQGAYPLVFATNDTQRAQIDSSGRLLVGTSSARTDLTSQLGTATNGLLQVEAISNSAANNGLQIIGNSAAGWGGLINLAHNGGSQGTNTLSGDNTIGGAINFLGNDGNGFHTAATIECRFDGAPANNSMPGKLSFYTTASGASSPTERMRIDNTGRGYWYSTGPVGLGLYSSKASGTSDYLMLGTSGATGIDTGSTRFQIFTNGNIANTNNSYGQISDIKLKENVTDASSQWNDIKAVQVRNFNFIGDATRQIGVVAQEVEQVSPGLIDEAPDRDKDGSDLGTVTKSVKYSVLYMKAVKALQEAMERIETLEASNADLLARVTALESA